MSSTSDPLAAFDASSSAIGYAYQLRIALARAWELKATGIDWSVCVEGRDDVEASTSEGTSLEQHKQHSQAGTLTDKDVDLWKTLRIWATGLVSGVIEPETTQFLLVTSALIAPGTVAAYLQAEDRDHTEALRLLELAASSTNNKALKASVESWKKLDDYQKERLIAQTRIIGNSPNIEDVRKTLEEQAGYAVKNSQRSAFIDYLEGWWFNRCIQSLRADETIPISGEEFDANYHSIKDRFHKDSLPVYDQLKSLKLDSVDRFASHCFVRQLELSEIGSKRILTAVKDYLRAGSQRSAWIRQKLIWPHDIDAYEQELIEAWTIVFDREVDTIGENATRKKKKSAAAAIYTWVEDAVAKPMRSDIPETFLTRGSLHILADEKRVGWHPDYLELLEEALEPLVES